MDKSNNLVVHKEATAGFESEIKRLESANGELLAELQIEKEKLHTLEAAFEHMRKQGKTKQNGTCTHPLKLAYFRELGAILKEILL